MITKINEPEDAKFDVSIYPNPATDHVTLEIISSEEVPKLLLYMYDVLGNTIFRETIKEPVFKQQIQLSYYATDLFFLQVLNPKSNERSIFKIMKVNF